MRGKAAATWNATTSRLHHNVDFRLNSQSLGACLTRNLSIGGRAWPNMIAPDPTHEIPLLLWCNSTLGLMVYWWCGVRQQGGRASVKITALPSQPTIDLRELTVEQLKAFDRLFIAFSGREFLAANEAYRDDARKELDAAIFNILDLPTDILESLELLRLKWCSEPSVHGGKNTKPPLDTA